MTVLSHHRCSDYKIYFSFTSDEQDDAEYDKVFLEIVVRDVTMDLREELPINAGIDVHLQHSHEIRDRKRTEEDRAPQ